MATTCVELGKRIVLWDKNGLALFQNQVEIVEVGRAEADYIGAQLVKSG